MQMFDNKIDELDTQNELRRSHHFLSAIRWSKLSDAQRVLFVAMAALALYHLATRLYEWGKAKQKRCPIKLPRSDLPNFFDSLRKEDIEEFMEDYEHCREFGFETFAPESIQKLQQEKAEKSGGKMYTFKDKKSDRDHHHDSVHSHASHLTSGFDIELLMVGEPCYQTHRCVDYYTKFNNQNATDEKVTKILLNLPMVPRDQLSGVRLDYAINNRKDAAAEIRSALMSGLNLEAAASLGLQNTFSQTQKLSFVNTANHS